MATRARKAKAKNGGRAKARARSCWRPGQSGNPKGRPPSGVALSDLVRDEVDPKALIERMQWLADNANNETVRFQALAWLADRGWGKAPLEIKVTPRNPYAKKVKGLTIAQLEVLAALGEEPDEFDDDSPQTTPTTPTN